MPAARAENSVDTEVVGNRDTQQREIQQSDVQPAEEDIPREEREQLRLGFAEFTTDDVPVEYRYLARSLPLELLDRLRDIPERIRTEEELLGAGRWLLHERRERVSTEIASLIEQRDELLFTTAGEERGRERARIDEEIAEKRRLLQALRSIGPDVVVDHLEARMPLSISRESEGQPLYAVDISSNSELELLVGGRMEYDDGYLILEVFLDAGVDDQMVAPPDSNAGNAASAGSFRRQLASTIVRPENAHEELELLREAIVAGVLNRPFAQLDVEVEQPAASLSLDGEVVGFGSVRLPYLEPDRYELRVVAPGHEEHTEEIEVTDSERREVAISLEALPRTTVTVESDPPGADLYVGSEWRGRTPVTIERPVGPRSAELRREGFEPSRFVLTDRGPDELSRVLAPDDVDLATELRDRREGFYRSLGWFAVSIPLPLILSGIWQNRVDFLIDNQADMSASERGQFVATTNLIDGVRWGGVALSGGLLINSIVQVVRYIRASRYYHFE